MPMIEDLRRTIFPWAAGAAVLLVVAAWRTPGALQREEVHQQKPTISSIAIQRRPIAADHLVKDLALIPTRLVIDAEAPARAGQPDTITVSLTNTLNQKAAFSSDITVAVNALSPSGKRLAASLTLARGSSEGQLHMTFPEVGEWTVTASERQLRSASMAVVVTAPPRSPVRPTTPHRSPETGSTTNGATSATTNPGISVGGTQHAVVIDHPTTSAGRLPVYVKCANTEPLADGRNATLITAQIVDDDGATHRPVRFALSNTGGHIDFDPLVIAATDPKSEARLTSTKVGPVTVRVHSLSSNVELMGDTEITVQFVPPISAITVQTSPPSCSLLDRAEVIVKLVNDQAMPVVTTTACPVSLAIDTGQGVIENVQLEIPAGKYEARTSFVPTWMGDVMVSASTTGLPKVGTHLMVTVPLLLIILSCVGGAIGGGLAYITGNKEQGKVGWRVLIGSVTGFVLYWLCVVGLIPVVGPMIVLNPISAVVIALLGGYSGTRVLAFALGKFGLTT